MLVINALKSFLKLVLSCFLLVLALASPLRAQDQQARYSLALQNVPLIDALRQVLNESAIDLVYSRDLVEGQVVYCHARNSTIDELLQCVLKETSLDYIRSSSGTYILVNKREVAPAYGNLRGGVYDADTGTPLPYANVLFVNRPGGVATNQDGLFNIPSLITGSLPIAVSYMGYESVFDTVQVRAGINNVQQFYLRAQSISIDPVIVNGLSQRIPSSMLGSGEIHQQDWDRTSGVKTNDVLRGASQLMGVSIQQPVADLQVHGGAGNEHITLLDGAPVRNPVSMGRHLGAFSPLALDRLVLQKTGFEAKYGSHLTGMVFVEHQLSTDKSFSNTLSIDPLSTNARVMGRFAGSNVQDFVVMASARISNWDVYEDQDVRSLLVGWNEVDPLATSFWVRREVTDATLEPLGGQPDVQFSDIHLGTRYKISPFHTLTGSLYRTTNNLSGAQGFIAQQPLDDPLNEDFVLVTQNDYSWLNWAGQLRHSWILGARSVLSTQFKGSSHNSRLGYRAILEEVTPEVSLDSFNEVFETYRASLDENISADENNYIRELGVYVDLSYGISPSNVLDVGIEIANTESEFTFFQPFVDSIKTTPSSWLFAGYMQDTLPVGRNWVLVPGIRLTYLSNQSPMYAEPRLAIRYDGASSKGGQVSARLAGGLYRQFVHQYELTGYGTSTIVPYTLFWLPIDKSISPSRAYHLAWEGLWTPSSFWTFRIESYVKWLDRILAFDYATVQDLEPEGQPVVLDDFVVPTEGRASGVGFEAEYEQDAFVGSVSYDYAHAEQRFPGRFGDERVTPPWNVPHQFSVDLFYRFAEQFALESNWVHHWGRSWAFRRTYYDVFDVWSPDADIVLPDLQNPEDDIVPDYMRLDFGIRYIWEGKGFKSRLRFSVLNILDRTNVYDYSIDAGQQDYARIPRSLPGRQFSLSMRVEY